MVKATRVKWMCIAIFAALAVTATSAQAYMYGFVWDRSVDYDPGTIHGSSLGNPNTDAMGIGVWQMESTNSAGDPLGGANPWYEGTTSIQVWDNSWYGGGPTWARGDNVNPPMGSANVTANVSNAALLGNAPLVRWTNPVDRPFPLEISGDLTINWRGGGGKSGNVDFDVAVVHFDASANTYDLLFGETYEKPTDDDSWTSLSMAVHIGQVWVEPGDQIIISPRGLSASGSTWPHLVDDLTLTMMPEPASLSLLGLGALGLAARRRRTRRT